MISLFTGSTWTVLLIILPLLYYVYYRKCRYFIFDQKEKVMKGNISRGKCPPFYPNGWYWLINSWDLVRGDVKYLNYCGRDVVLFRGQDGLPYVLEAYCAHMGANLGIGGKVRYDSCIECPFHGWTYDGKTGNCVVTGGENKVRRTADRYEYFDLQRCTPVPSDGQQTAVYLQKVAEQPDIKLKRYECREINGSILVWYHADEELREKPSYELFNLDDHLVKEQMDIRGESDNYVNCHIQEVPENGADIRHFEYLHETILDFIPFIKFNWTMLSAQALNADLRESMAHVHPSAHAYKMHLFDTFLTYANRSYVNTMSLDGYINFFGKHKFFLFNTTGFQIGPSVVYLFLWSPYFKLTMFHTTTPLEKFNQRVMHRIFTSKAMPYWLSALLLMGEVKQLFSDMFVWDHKRFGDKIHYNMNNYPDRCLYAWRNWYAQFYQGCYERETKSLVW